ncbi:Signal-transduction histidine kinase senX3 [Variovorax sp. PBL-H6]|uniref:sensor histidine kinase n=1 Tax=Variovorax sp. PBL-H6 TaxID=434009 RepID=UPI0013184900|nr:HAMP domain-containing sensor histidine kinase [Variovorax sp. PBL-H6]VTU22656.1 Signal-transduction histidine kinase senX3 [Variovorax sp. PBL-H6]
MSAIADAAATAQGSSANTAEPAEQQRTRLLLTVSPAHKHLAMRAFAMQQVVNWTTVIGLLAIHYSYPIMSPDALWRWACIFLATWLLRILMIAPLRRLAPSAVERSALLKSLPLASGLIGSTFWVWTTQLFIGPELSMRELMLFVGFLAISISMTGMWPVTPVTSLVYYLLLWSGFSCALWTNATASLPAIAVLNVCVASVIWLNVFVSIRQVNAQLARGAELDRALCELQRSNAQLEALKNTAWRTLETRSVFFSEASHDLRQQLHAAKLWVSSAMAATRDGADAARPLERLGQELNALQIYIDRVLDFARIEALDVGVQLERTSIQSLFQKLGLSFEDALARGERTLRFRRASFVVRTDASMLLRILENLVSNALKYTRGGVLVCARRRRACLALQVWDQGPGIKPGARQRIFEAFHREDEPDDKRSHKGSGLGLAIVKRFADRLGYAVEVSSELGKGACFTLLIPIDYAEPIVVTDHRA